MAKSVATQGRLAAVSNAGEMVTGVLESGWSPLPRVRDGKILQFGLPSKKFGLPSDSWKFISSHVGIEDSELVTVDCSAKGTLRCQIEGGDSGAPGYWYDIGDIIDELPETCELLIVNRTEEPSDQNGIINHLSLFHRTSLIAITGIEDPGQHGLALRIAQLCRGFIRLDSVKNGRKEKVTVAIIEPAPPVKTPSPMPYPSIAKILPKRMVVKPPEGIANDYLHISKQVRDRKDNWAPKTRISIEIPLYN